MKGVEACRGKLSAVPQWAKWTLSHGGPGRNGSEGRRVPPGRLRPQRGWRKKERPTFWVDLSEERQLP
ncbi:MAG: hypothetical protein MJY45_06265, partial [Bacteroidales bacterium]|nr:hypothetical protein [Bacteroidales bacterium]